MNFFTNKKITKITMSILAFLILFNFIAPNVVLADDDSTFAGKLFKPIAELLAFVADSIIKLLQKVFLGNGDIAIQGIDELGDSSTFIIRYGPATIFSGEIPGLDANFFNPQPAKPVYKPSEWAKGSDYDLSRDASTLGSFGLTNEMITDQSYLSIINKDGVVLNLLNLDKVVYCYRWTKDYKEYCLVNTVTSVRLADIAISVAEGTRIPVLSPLAMISACLGVAVLTRDKIQEFFGTEWTLYSRDLHGKELKGEERTSTAQELQSIIALWYKRLRNFSLVALLSILVYVAIRIIMSSTGQDKAKYKKMLTDWLVAICLLFVLQYIMALTMTAVDRVSDIFSVNLIGENYNEDILMSKIRTEIGDSSKVQFTSIFEYLIIYIVLVVWTGVFTVHYIKRLIYLAFFTMIAPLISFTYPLDKIKDGQAQAFTIWIREYIFNALLPVLHLILYSIFVSTAIQINNWIIAIVAIGFMIPAEKFFRKMFGFDKASSTSQMGAAAGGALVMNAINKLGNGPKKNEATPQKPVRTTGSSGGTFDPNASTSGTQNRSPRTSQNNGGEGTPEESRRRAGGEGIPEESGRRAGEEGTPEGSGRRAGGEGTPEESGRREGEQEEGATEETARNATNQSGSTIYGDVAQAGPKPQKGNIRQGLSDVFHQRFNKKTIKRYAKKKGKKFIAALGGATLGVYGLGAAISSGDLGNVPKYILASTMSGYKGTQGVEDKIAGEFNRTNEVLKKGSLGADGYQARKTEKELSEDWDFNKACKKAGITSKSEKSNMIRQFTANGVGQDDIVKAIKARNNYHKNNPGKQISQDEMVKMAALNNGISDATWGDPLKRQSYLKHMYDNILQDPDITADTAREKVQALSDVISSMKG